MALPKVPNLDICKRCAYFGIRKKDSGVVVMECCAEDVLHETEEIQSIRDKGWLKAWLDPHFIGTLVISEDGITTHLVDNFKIPSECKFKLEQILG